MQVSNSGFSLPCGVVYTLTNMEVTRWMAVRPQEDDFALPTKGRGELHVRERERNLN